MPNQGAGGNNNPAAPGGQGSAANSSNLESNKDITMYRAVLKNELLGTTIDGIGNHSHYAHAHAHSGAMNGNSNGQSSQTNGANGQTGGQLNAGMGNATFSISSGLNHTSRLMSALQPREMTSVFQVIAHIYVFYFGDCLSIRLKSIKMEYADSTPKKLYNFVFLNLVI